MRKTLLFTLFLAIFWIKVGYAKVEVASKPYEVNVMVEGVRSQGLYVEGTVVGVREFLEELLFDSEALAESQQEFIITVLDYLYQKPTNWRVSIQPLAAKGGKDNYTGYLSADTFVYEGNPGANYGSAASMLVGCDSGYAERGLHKAFSCPCSPSSCTYTDAEFYVYISYNYLKADEVFWTYPASSYWDEYTVTWNTQPAYYCSGGSCSQTGDVIYPSDTGYKRLNHFNRWIYNVCIYGTTNEGLKTYSVSDKSNNCDNYPSNYHDILLDTYDGNSNLAYVILYYTTDVDLSGFWVEPKDSEIIVKWTTSNEQNNAGWNIYRAVGKSNDYIKINETIITPYQYSYEYIDFGLENDTTYCYKLEAVDLDGTTQIFGPECAKPYEDNGVLMATGVSSDDDSEGSGATGGCGWF